MRLHSAYDDFVLRTLGALGGIWRKLAFVTRLRDSQGKYHHWGMERAYGELAAGEAIKRAHRELVLELVNMRIADVIRQPESSELLAGISAVAICPTELSRATLRHVEYLLEASRLTSGQSRSTHRVA